MLGWFDDKGMYNLLKSKENVDVLRLGKKLLTRIASALFRMTTIDYQVSVEKEAKPFHPFETASHIFN